MKGILFKPDMIKAIAEGRKTQTRRIINPQPYEYQRTMVWAFRKGHLATQGFWNDHACYQVGDVVYIKEGTWISDCGKYRVIAGDSQFNNPVISESKTYRNVMFGTLGRPVPSYRDYAFERGFLDGDTYIKAEFHHRKSPRFMPAWAARYFIRITSVRPERLNQISSSDVTKEGLDTLVSFMILWDRLNKKRGYGWETNCWVWRLEFQKA